MFQKHRYPVFLRVVREWRFLKMMKRAGRGHDPSGGIEATGLGECALLCPACPQPGKNMAPGWENVPENERYVHVRVKLSLLSMYNRFLHALFIAIDGNFRLKRKLVSSETLDPGLCRGYAYFVEETAYKQYLESFLNEVEPVSLTTISNV
jgi:hypothetical protein